MARPRRDLLAQQTGAKGAAGLEGGACVRLGLLANGQALAGGSARPRSIVSDPSGPGRYWASRPEFAVSGGELYLAGLGQLLQERGEARRAGRLLRAPPRRPRAGCTPSARPRGAWPGPPRRGCRPGRCLAASGGGSAAPRRGRRACRIRVAWSTGPGRREPVEGLLAQSHAFRVLALAGGGQRGVAGGVVAVARSEIVGQRGRGGKDHLGDPPARAGRPFARARSASSSTVGPSAPPTSGFRRALMVSTCSASQRARASRLS